MDCFAPLAMTVKIPKRRNDRHAREGGASSTLRLID
jgi:hypothetical protein